MAQVHGRGRHAKQASVSRLGAVQHPETALIVKDTVWQALDILPPRRRAIVIMYELEDLDIPTIASLLGITEITVRWHLSRGRRELTDILKTHFGVKR